MKWMPIVVGLLVIVARPLSTNAQEIAPVDTVIVRAGKENREVERRGSVIDWLGDELRMESQGRVTSYETENIVSVQTPHVSEYVAALELISNRKMVEAIPMLSKAMETEPRIWVRRIIAADLVRALHYAGDNVAAGNAFVLMLEDDPKTRFYSIIPLCWLEERPDGRVVESAGQWMESKDLSVQLLGASWLLNSNRRADAVSKLEALSRDFDAKIAHLAAAQLWRTQYLSANEATIKRWQLQLERMPESLRAGPLVIFGDALQRAGMTNESLISWMKVPILYETQFREAGFALRQTANLLQNEGRSQDALRLWRELANDFSESPWAVDAQQNLSGAGGN
ncbi:MAG: hypothetical protein R3C03_22360 [Pirellulaceae bacterium]